MLSEEEVGEKSSLEKTCSNKTKLGTIVIHIEAHVQMFTSGEETEHSQKPPWFLTVMSLELSWFIILHRL